MVLGRPWFERAWVRQEVILAQEFNVSLGAVSLVFASRSSEAGLLDAQRRIYFAVIFEACL
jgi:hypothetical protein